MRVEGGRGFVVKLCSHPDQNGHVSSVSAEALIMIAGEALPCKPDAGPMELWWYKY